MWWITLLFLKKNSSSPVINVNICYFTHSLGWNDKINIRNMKPVSSYTLFSSHPPSPLLVWEPVGWCFWFCSGSCQDLKKHDPAYFPKKSNMLITDEGVGIPCLLRLLWSHLILPFLSEWHWNYNSSKDRYEVILMLEYSVSHLSLSSGSRI